VAGRASPLQGLLAFLAALLTGASSVVEANQALRRIGTVGHEEANPRAQLTGGPFELGHHPTRPIPRARLVQQVVEGPHGGAWLQPLRPLQVWLEHSLQYGIAGQAERIQKLVLLQKLIALWASKPGVTPELLAQPGLGVPVHNRGQELPPTVSAGDVALAQPRAFTVTALVEAEQRVLADTPVVAVVLGALLLARYRALRTNQVQEETLGLPMGHGC